MRDFILKGNICYSSSLGELQVRPDSYLVCVDGCSRGVHSDIPAEYQGLPLVDYGNHLILPGMVDLHIHGPQYSFRGTSMDLELMDWLNRYTFPEESKYANKEYGKKAYSFFVDGLRRGATTRACIFATCHRDSTVLLMDLLEESGLITYVGKVNMDREAPASLLEESAEVSAEETRKWLAQIQGKYLRTKPILTPRFIPSCTDELMAQLEQIQRDTGIGVQSHLSESPGEIQFVKELRPQNRFYGEAYDDYGLFGKDKEGRDVPTIMAHCVWSQEEEAALLHKNGVFVAHCPGSNMNLSSGIAPIRRYLDREISIGIGTDVAGGHSDSMFRAITDAVQVSKLYWRLVDSDGKPLTFAEAFFLATMGGGRFFGKVGSFEPGYELDVLVLDDSILPHPQELSVCERLERAVYLGLDRNGIVAKYAFGTQIF